MHSEMPIPAHSLGAGTLVQVAAGGQKAGGSEGVRAIRSVSPAPLASVNKRHLVIENAPILQGS